METSLEDHGGRFFGINFVFLFRLYANFEHQCNLLHNCSEFKWIILEIKCLKQALEFYPWDCAEMFPAETEVSSGATGRGKGGGCFVSSSSPIPSSPENRHGGNATRGSPRNAVPNGNSPPPSRDAAPTKLDPAPIKRSFGSRFPSSRERDFREISRVPVATAWSILMDGCRWEGA